MDRSSTSPRLVLALLLVAAVGIGAGGVLLSRREVAERTPNDRSALMAFAENLQQELRRLEDLHESHLMELVRQVNPDDRAQTARDGEDVIGVVRCSFLSRSPGRPDQHVSVGPVLKMPPPLPTLALPSRVKPSDFVLLDTKKCFDETGPDHGWLKTPDGPMFFWLRKLPSQLRVLTIQPEDVRLVMKESVSKWASTHAGSMAYSSDDEGLFSPEGEIVPIAGYKSRSNDSANWVLPLPTRFGTWKLAAWDRAVTRVTIHKPTLIVTATLAAFLTVLGGIIFLQQRRALKQAAERVSFVNRVSHELRTPLTNIVLNLDVAAEALQDASPQAVRRLDLVREEAGRLARLIDNVLVFSRREQGKLTLRVIEGDPDAVVDEVLTLFSAAFQRRRIRVERDRRTSAVRCAFDPDALAQIAANLFSNVEKYVPDGVVVVKSRVEAGNFVLSVADDGRGIAQRDRQRIFQPFERVHDSTNEGSSGTGLGLSIARDLARQMAGDLRLIDSDGGCIFELTLPLLKVSAEVAAATSTISDPLASPVP